MAFFRSGLFFLTLLIFSLFQSTSDFARANTSPADSVKYRFAPVVVTGQRYQLPLKDVAASISIISQQEIASTDLVNIADAVSCLTPGVYTTRRSTLGYGVAALAGGSITVRGIGGKPNSQVLVLIDGRPDFQGIFSHPLNDAYLLDNVDHIEVLRGPGSAVYGTNALGGVINIITKKLPESGFHTHLQAGYGSYNSQKYLLQQSGIVGKLQFLLSAGMNKSDSHRENGDFESKNFALKLGYRLNDKFKLVFQGSSTPYTFHDPGPENITLNGYFDYGKIERNSMDLTISNQFANSDGNIKIHGNFGHHELSDGWISDDQTNGIIAFQNFYFPHEIKTTVGFDIKRYGGTSESNGTKLGTYFNDERAIYLHLQKNFVKKLVLAGGIRAENNSHFGTEWIPKLGVTFHPFAQTAIRTSVSKGFRTPSVKDMFLFPPANQELKPERLWNYELGWTQYFNSHFSFDLCSFYYKGEQFIETVMVVPGQMQNLNTGSNEAKGVEASLRGKFFNSLSANLSYSYLDSKTTLPFSPNKFNFWFAYQKGKLTASLYGEYITNLYASYQPQGFPPKTVIEKMGDYSLVHAKVSYRLLKKAQLSLTVENLLDESYEILKGYPMPGRTFFSRLDVNF